MTFAEQQQGFVQQLLRADVLLLGPGMARRQQHGEGFLVHLGPHQAAAGERQSDDDGIQLPALQLAAQHMSVVFLNEQRHFRRFRVHSRYQSREQVRRNGEDGTHSQRRTELVTLAHRHLLQQIGLFQYPLCLGHNRLRLGRDHHFPRAALEQRHAELFLELLDGGAESGLTDIAHLGRVTEVPLTSQSDQIAKFC